MFYELFQRTEKGGKVPNSFYEVSVTLTPKPDEEIQRKKNYTSLSLTNTHAKILNKSSAEPTLL